MIDKTAPTQADYDQLMSDLALYRQQNAILAHQLEQANEKSNRLWKLETLLAICGMMVEHDEAGWYINYGHGQRVFRPMTLTVDTFDVVEDNEE
jgi:hypothetical protein